MKKIDTVEVLSDVSRAQVNLLSQLENHLVRVREANARAFEEIRHHLNPDDFRTIVEMMRAS